MLIEIGSYYERTDLLSEAEKILTISYSLNPGNAYCVLPLVKTLCRNGKIGDAQTILEKSENVATPKEIVKYAKIFLLKTRGQFSESRDELKALLESDKESIHRWGQWADLHLSWCQFLQGDEKAKAVNDGLRYVNETIRGKNIPALMATRKLALLSGNEELISKITKAIKEIDHSIILE